MIKDILFKAINTSKINESEVLDFIYVQKKVFNQNYNREKFKKKYLKNIFGDSLIILAYYKEKCIGARAFWRNDLEDKCAYQPCDTAVLESYRGCGIFSSMTLKGLEVIGKNAIIYNFPNKKSYPGYIKLGWALKDVKKIKVAFSIKDFKNLPVIDEDYSYWVFNNLDENCYNNFFFYIKKNKKYFLVKKRKWNLFVLIGTINKKWIIFLKKAKYPILLCYSKKGYFGRGLFTVIKNEKRNIDIPIYKIDTLF